MKFELRHYDIVGGSVNDVYVYGIIELETTKTVYNEGTAQEFTETEPSDKQIFHGLKNCGFLAKTAKLSQLEFDGDNETIYVNIAKNGEPFCELRKQ